jgi:PAS domain S-box-containing protein/putative nucleotidyltransferase with HDIG domain
MKAIRSFLSDLNAFTESKPNADLDFWRERIFHRMLAAVLVWGLLALVPSVWLSFSTGLYFIAIVDVFAYSVALLIFINRKRISYQIRALFFVLVGLTLGAVVFVVTGDEGAGLFWLFAVPPFASLLLGLRWGLLFFTIDTGLLAIIGILIFLEIPISDQLDEFSLGSWIVYCVNFLAANAIVTLPLGALLDGLFQSSAREKTLQQDYQILFENNPLPIWVYQTQSLKFLAVNEAAVTHYGYSLAEFLAMTIKDIRPVIEIPRLEKNLAIQGERQLSGPWIHKKKDGSLINVEIFSHHIRFANQDARLVLANDVTELTRSQSELIEREELYRILAENSQTLVCTHDLQGSILSVNDVGVQLTGYSRDQIMKMTLNDLVAPDWRKFLPRYLSRITRLGKARGLMQIQTSTGEKRIWEYNNVMWADAKGKPIVRGMAIDITERLEAQRKLEQADQILQNVKSLVLVLDREAKIIYVSPSSKEMIGYDAAELMGDGWWEFSRSNAIEAFGEKALMKRVARNEIPLQEKPYERPIRTKNGETRWIEWQDVAGPNQTIIGVGRDVTENKKAEQVLRQRLSELEAIREISMGLRSAANLDDMLPLILDSTLRIMDTASGAIWLHDKVSNELRVAISRGYVNKAGVEIEIPPEKPGTGLVGSIFAGGWTHLSNEYRQDLDIPPEIREFIPPEVGGASVPIRTEAGPIGVLVVNTRLPRTLTEVDVNLLTTLAEIAGNAIHRSTLHGKTEQQLKLFQALSEIDRAILSNLDLSFNLKLLVENVVAQLGVDAANVMLFDPVLQTLQSVQGAGFRTQAFEKRIIELGEGIAGKVGAERRIIHVNQLQVEVENPRLAKALIGEGFTTYYGIPLIAKGALRGVLEIFNRTSLGPDEEWFGLLDALAGRAALAIDTIKVLENLERSNQDLLYSYDATIEGWSRALDLRDKETEGHSQRVTQLGLNLARRMGQEGEQLVNFRRGALLHDIGKMGVPDNILFKPAKLTDEEWVIMKQHTVFARDMLMDIGYLKDSLDIPYSHHERWDGSGYPLGLSGEDIPIAARIFAVADVFDALTSDRPYRKAWTKEKTVTYIRAESGKLFDPKVVDAFLKSHFATRSLQMEKNAML